MSILITTWSRSGEVGWNSSALGSSKRPLVSIEKILQGSNPLSCRYVACRLIGQTERKVVDVESFDVCLMKGRWIVCSSNNSTEAKCLKRSQMNSSPTKGTVMHYLNVVDNKNVYPRAGLTRTRKLYILLILWWKVFKRQRWWALQTDWKKYVYRRWPLHFAASEQSGKCHFQKKTHIAGKQTGLPNSWRQELRCRTWHPWTFLL